MTGGPGAGGRELLVGSLFSGAGGFDIGFHQAGFRTAWFCEIDPTARAVLARHWPEVPCHEDITQLDPGSLPRVDCIIGGPPCQGFSVAGKRLGLADDRSGLFWEFLRIVAGVRPEWVVIENVPGLLSQNAGRDFAAILGELVRLGYGWAFRVLDAQHWGLAQRRRRVFIVGRAGGNVLGAASVLFESDRGEGDSPAGGEAGQELAYCLSASVRHTGDGHGNAWNTTYIADTVRSHPRPGSNSVGNLTIAAATLRSRNHAPGVSAPGRGGEDNANLVLANTVQASAGHHGHSSPRGDGGDNLVVANCLSSRQTRLDGDSQDKVLAVAENQPGELRTADISPALGAGGGKPGSGFSAAWNGSTVRRLMPVECERLQGWPDGHTEGFADGPRYRLIGNGVAAPVARWIAERIAAVEAAS